MKKGTENYYPIFLREMNRDSLIERGISIRLEIASRAMKGLLSNPAMVDTDLEPPIEWVTNSALNYADALIKLEEETRNEM